MEIHFDLIVLLHLLAAVLGVLVSLVLMHSSRKPHLGFNKWLGFSIFSLAIALLVAFLLLSRIGFMFPHVYRVGNVFALAYMPLSYLYIRSVVNQRSPTKWDWLHALPLVFYLVDYMPFFLLSADAKLEMLRIDMKIVDNTLTYDEGWITSPHIQLVIRTIQFFVYWILEVRLLRGIYTLNIPGLEKENKSWLRWAMVHVGIQSLLFLPAIIVWIFSLEGYIFFSTNVFAAIALFSSTIILFFRPDILYGIRGLIVFKEETLNVPEVIPGASLHGENNNQALYLNFDTVRGLQDKLEKLMQGAPFRRHGYSSIDLAKDLAIPPYQLSAFLNQNLGTNFNDFINERRIRFCLEQLGMSNWESWTIEAIGSECGFNNRNTFTSSFKKVTGQTPSAYLRGHEYKTLPNV